MVIYDHIQKLLLEERFRPRSIFDKFKRLRINKSKKKSDKIERIG